MPTPSAQRADLVLKFEYTGTDCADPVANGLARGRRNPKYAAEKKAFMAHRYNNRWGLAKVPGTQQQYGQVLSKFADFCDSRGEDYAVYPLKKVAEFIQERWDDVQRKNGFNPGQTMEHHRKALKVAMLCQYGNPCTSEEWDRYDPIHGPVKEAQQLTLQLRAR